MAILTPYTSQAAIRNAGGAPQAASYRTPSDFMMGVKAGRDTGQDMQAFAQGLGKFGKAVFDMGIDRMRQQNATDMLRSKLELEDAYRDFDSRFREQNKGASARDAEEAYNQFFRDRLNILKQEWGGNKFHMVAAEQMWAGIRQPALKTAVAYRDQERNADTDAVIQADLLKTLQQAQADPSLDDARRQTIWQEHATRARAAAGQSFDPKMGQWSGGRNIDAMLIQGEEKFRLAAREGGIEAIQRLLDANDEKGAKALYEKFYRSGAIDGAARYVAGKESGQAGSLAVGYDRNGGTSYGKYQLASRPGTMGEFVSWLEKNGASEAAGLLKEAGAANTGSKDGKMPEVWRSLVRSGKITDAMQDKFILETHVKPVMDKLPPQLRDLAENNPAFARAVFSTAVQHGPQPGGASKLIAEAWRRASSGGSEIPADGLVEAGNIDLHNRPVVRNADGSISTVRSKSFNMDGREVLIPTVAEDGSGILDDDAAIEQYRKSGKHLGIFDTPDNASAYGKRLSAQQKRLYADAGTTATDAGGDNGERFINALYDAREKQFGSSTAEVRAGVMNRLKAERSDALAGLRSGGPGGRPIFDAETRRKVDGMIETATADSKAKSYMARIEAGEDEHLIRKEILGLPPKERGPVNSQFHAYKAVYDHQQNELVQDSIVGLREQLFGTPIGQAYRTVHDLPENTPAQRKIKKQALADYSYLSSMAGLHRGTDPNAYNELVDKIFYGEISGPNAVRDLKADPLAVKLSEEDRKRLERDLKGASTVKQGELKEAFKWAIGGEKGPKAKLTDTENKEFLRFKDWAESRLLETNRAKEPGYLKKLAADYWRMGGEVQAWYAPGYGRDKTRGNALDDPTWIPDLAGERKAEIDALFSREPDLARAWANKYGGNVEYGKRGYFKKLLNQEIGRRERPAQTVQGETQ